jgi:hypothetical protein
LKELVLFNLGMEATNAAKEVEKLEEAKEAACGSAGDSERCKSLQKDLAAAKIELTEAKSAVQAADSAAGVTASLAVVGIAAVAVLF